MSISATGLPDIWRMRLEWLISWCVFQQKDSPLKTKQLTREEVTNNANNVANSVANNVSNVNNVNANVSIALVTPMVADENSQLNSNSNSNANCTVQGNIAPIDAGKLANNLVRDSRKP